MDLKIKTLNGSHKTLSVSDNIFSKKYNEPLIHQVLISFINNSHKGSKAQKRRSDVSGGGAKPWRQKGLGRARAGTIRSPIFRKGGVTFASKPLEFRRFKSKINKKMYKSSIQSILSELFRQKKLTVIDEIGLNDFKTKSFINLLSQYSFTGKILFVVADTEYTEQLLRASRNIKSISVIRELSIDPFLLISHTKIVITKTVLKGIEERFFNE